MLSKALMPNGKVFGKAKRLNLMLQTKINSIYLANSHTLQGIFTWVMSEFTLFAMSLLDSMLKKGKKSSTQWAGIHLDFQLKMQLYNVQCLLRIGLSRILQI